MNKACYKAASLIILLSAAMLVSGCEFPNLDELAKCRRSADGGDFSFTYTRTGGSSKAECVLRKDLEKAIEPDKQIG